MHEYFVYMYSVPLVIVGVMPQFENCTFQELLIIPCGETVCRKVNFRYVIHFFHHLDPFVFSAAVTCQFDHIIQVFVISLGKDGTSVRKKIISLSGYTSGTNDLVTAAVNASMSST
jgi:hypothetical protein